MAIEAAEWTAPPERRLTRRLLTVGPGLVFILGAIGPRDLITNSMAGATHGYTLLWMLAVALVARYVILDATARYVMVTGESLLAGYEDVAIRYVASRRKFNTYRRDVLNRIKTGRIWTLNVSPLPRAVLFELLLGLRFGVIILTNH